MRKSLIASFALHVLLLGAALFVLPAPDAFQVPPQDSIPVDIVSVEDFSKRQAMEKSDTKKKVEKPKAKKQDVVKAVEPQKKVAPEETKAAKVPAAPEKAVKEAEKPVEKPVEKVVEKKPEPVPEPVKKAEEPPPPDQLALEGVLKKTEDEVALAEKLAADEAKAVEEKKVADEKKAADKKKKAADAEKKKKAAEERKVAEAAAAEAAAAKAAKLAKDFNPDEISALLDKDSDQAAAPQKPTEDNGEPAQGEATLQGNDDAIAATLVDLLRQNLSKCWRIPPGAREADVTVKVRFRLDQAGNLMGEPEVLGGSSNPMFETTAQSVLSAVAQCQSYDYLPADHYDLWKENTMLFNPNKMNPA
jgi:TolA protein